MSNAAKKNITVLLKDYAKGNGQAAEALWPMVYEELHRLAKSYMSRERNARTLQPTALVNEAFVRLAGGKKVDWQNREHFFAVAATVMRRVLLDYSRGKRAEKRGSGGILIEFDEKLHTGAPSGTDLFALDEALTQLEVVDPRLARVVELRYFAGLSLEEISELLNVSLSTIKRDWNAAKLWLYRELSETQKD